MAYNIAGVVVFDDLPEYDDDLDDDDLDNIELDIPTKRDLREWREWADGLTISQLINSELPF